MANIYLCLLFHLWDERLMLHGENKDGCKLKSESPFAKEREDLSTLVTYETSL